MVAEYDSINNLYVVEYEFWLMNFRDQPIRLENNMVVTTEQLVDYLVVEEGDYRTDVIRVEENFIYGIYDEDEDSE